ncbi:MAG: hypothetical protein PHG23_03020 [Candidatus Pacebacteria bacterium]|nr:hypothetical protein [Candidatus Paceibacterota bacterium]
MLTERQSQILKTLIKEHVKTAEPVSSDFLAKRHDFGLCPSAIRIEMNILLRGGFLEQPHTSAGRIPTDKAYRHFVNQILEEKEKEKETAIEQEIENLIKKDFEDRLKFASGLAKLLAETSSSLAIIHFLNNRISLKEGWDELVNEPEFFDRSFITGLIDFVDNFEEKIKKINTEGMNVYIGREIALPKIRNMSLICSTCQLAPEEKIFVSILGPRRMDYGRNINLIQRLNKALNENL